MGSMERKIALGWGLTLVIVVFMLVYWLNESNRMAMASEKFRLEAVGRGAESYVDHCASCHGDEGQGITNVGPVLNSRSFLELNDDQGIHAMVRDGRPGTMMPGLALEEGGPLRDHQIKELVAFIRNWEETAPLLPTPTPVIDAASQYAQYCAGCHGPNGEGTEAISLILNSKGFLSRTDDSLLHQLIAQGRPEQGMPTFGGELSRAEINALVAFIRVWEATAPEVELDTETLYARYCAFCHGANGEGATNVPVVLNSNEFLLTHDDEYLRQIITQGHENMPAWGKEKGGVLTTAQVDELVLFIRAWEKPGETTTEETTAEEVSTPSFAADVLPVFQEHCTACHSADLGLGGWDASTYNEVMESGDHAPVVNPGDPEGSLLVQKLLGTQTIGSPMPVPDLLPPEQVQVVVEWVLAGALDD